jgi:hypothetical protein
VYELQVIPEFTPLTCYHLIPFVEVKNKFLEPKSVWRKIREEKNNYLLLRYTSGIEGSNDNVNYAGSAENLYVRFRSSHSKDYSLGFTCEKDAGEKIIWSPSSKRYGMDYWSYHFSLFNKGKFKAITLGDYQLQFGQGLILSSGFSIGKGSETITTIRRNNLGIKSYTSVLESGYFRGGACTYSPNSNVDVTGFYSNTNIDARINSDSLIEDPFITSIQSSGYHRTSQEISAKHQIKLEAIGGNLSYLSTDNNFHLGVSFLNAQYSVPIKKTARVYNQFAFEGKNNFNSSIDYSYVKNNFNFFGEGAISRNGGKAYLAGFIASLSSRVEIAMIYRNYAKDFQGIYGNAFRENTNNTNERGVYWGIKIKPFTSWTLSAYYDKFSFPWLKYQVNAPSNGYGYLGRLHYQPSKLIQLYVQIRTENKEKNQTGIASNINCIVPTVKKNYMIHLDYKAKNNISLKSRVQVSSYQQNSSPTFGYFIMEEINLDLGKFKLCTRYALFDTDDYDNRQYAYEKDVLYSFSIPALFGKGTRVYAVVQIKILKNVDVWLKYAKTRYLNKTEKPDGQNLSEMKAEVRYIF